MRLIIEDEATLKKPMPARFFWRSFRVIALIVASSSFLDFLLNYEFKYPNGMGSESWEATMLVFIVASLTVMATVPKGSATKRNETPWWHRLPDWSLVTYSLVLGLGFNWACAFLWFSRRYAAFSAPVIGVAALIVAFYAVIGLLVARLSGGNWRTAVLVFSFAQVLSGMILRLGILR